MNTDTKRPTKKQLLELAELEPRLKEIGLLKGIQHSIWEVIHDIQIMSRGEKYGRVTNPQELIREANKVLAKYA